MSEIDDLPLDSGRDHVPTTPPAAQASSGQKMALLITLVVGALAAGVWFYRSQPSTGGTRAVTSPTGAGPRLDGAVAAPPPAAALPPAGAMDPFVRTLFATLSTHPELLKWLATDDLVASMATAIDRLAQGQSPARDLGALRPAAGFTTARQDGVARVAPASHARYAPLAAAVASVDPAKLAAAFTTLRPRIAEAYALQGHPNESLDDALHRAIAVVTSTPDVPEDAALVPGTGGYAYADPAFEGLPAAQKHLVRMGPEHTRRIRDAARQFGAALAATR